MGERADDHLLKLHVESSVELQLLDKEPGHQIGYGSSLCAREDSLDCSS